MDHGVPHVQGLVAAQAAADGPPPLMDNNENDDIMLASSEEEGELNADNLLQSDSSADMLVVPHLFGSEGKDEP